MNEKPMNYSVFRFTLNMHSNKSQVSIPVAYGDTAVKLYISLTDGGNSYFINDGCIAIISGVKADGTKFSHRCLVEHNTTIVYEFTEQTTSFAGLVNCEVTIYGVNGKAITAPKFIIVVDEKLYYDTEVLSANDMCAIQTILQTEPARGIAEAQRDAAENGVFQEDGTRVGGRVNAEIERDSAEKIRDENEIARKDAEDQRRIAENARKDAEDQRGLKLDKIEADLKSFEKKVDKRFTINNGASTGKGYLKLTIPNEMALDVVVEFFDGTHTYVGRFSAICGQDSHNNTTGHYLLPYSNMFIPTHIYPDGGSMEGSWYIPIDLTDGSSFVTVSIKAKDTAWKYAIDTITCEYVSGVPSEAEELQPIFLPQYPTSYLVKGNTIPLRDNVGHLQAAYPYYGDDVANKTYVDLNTIGWKSTPPKKGEPVLAVRFSGHVFIGGGDYYYGSVTEDQVWWIHRQGTNSWCSAFDSEPTLDWNNYTFVIANDTKSVTLYKKQTGWEVSPPGDAGGDSTWWSSSADEFIETKVYVSKYLY